jgi:hypothetical protein
VLTFPNRNQGTSTRKGDNSDRAFHDRERSGGIQAFQQRDVNSEPETNCDELSQAGENRHDF